MQNQDGDRAKYARIRPRRLVLIGSVLVDILMYVDHLPERGGDIVARQSMVTSGGGFNVLVAAARVGLPTVFAGRVGDGPLGAQIMTDLTSAGIPLVLPRVTGEDTGFDIGLVEPDAERTFATSPGTEARLSLYDLRAIPLQAGDAVYISGYDLDYPVSGDSLAAWLPALPADCLLVIDPGPLVVDIPVRRLQPALARCDILSLSARESALLTGIADIPTAAQELVTRIAANGLVVARASAEGCWIASQDFAAVHIPGRPAHAVDTTGAGDTHVAAMLARLALGDDIFVAARIANIAASLSIEKIGPATGPTARELGAALTGET